PCLSVIFGYLIVLLGYHYGLRVKFAVGLLDVLSIFYIFMMGLNLTLFLAQWSLLLVLLIKWTSHDLIQVLLGRVRGQSGDRKLARLLPLFYREHRRLVRVA